MSLSAYVRLCFVSVAAQSPSNIPSLTAAARQSLINNASFILKSGLTLAAFCLLPGARVRMYRLENKALKKKKKKENPSLDEKESPTHPQPHPSSNASTLQHSH